MRKLIGIISIILLLWTMDYGLWTRYEANAGNIVLRVITANPSQEDTQKVPVKVYLPKEIKPEDVLDRGDLEVAYDNQEGAYYVYGEYELKPQEVLEKEIEIRDIWVVPDVEISALRLESAKLFELLKNTEFVDRIKFLINNIESKLNQISENQKNSPPNPERHISDYRENLRILESVKADLLFARSMLTQAKPLPQGLLWRLLIGIVVFLGLLGLVFYLLWQKQIKSAVSDTFSFPKPGEPPETKPARHENESQTQDDSRVSDDIEKIINNQEK